MDIIQAIYFKLGYRAILSKRKDNGIYNLSITNKKYITARNTNGKGLNITKINYKGVVWCPNTVFETFIARRNGRIIITGNTFPEKLVETPIEACCPPKICTKCGLPQIRIAIRDHPGDSEKEGIKYENIPTYGKIPPRGSDIKGLKWVKCQCNAPTKPGVVFDPFAGTATTLRVASKKAMDWVGCEVSEEYHQIAMKKMKPFSGKRLTDFMEK